MSSTPPLTNTLDASVAIGDRILQFIQTNRVSTTEVADALYKTGELDAKLHILTPGTRAAGRIHYVPAVHGSNWHTHLYLANAPEGSMVYVDASNCEGKAIFGSLVAKYAMLYRRTAGLVVGGLLRDVQFLVKERYPVWCYGATPIGCINEETAFDEAAYLEKKLFYQDAILVGDDSGVVIIHAHQQTEELLARLQFIEEQEDIWFDCIDRLKWNTFDTVCLKKYQGFVYPG